MADNGNQEDFFIVVCVGKTGGPATGQ